MTLDAVTAKEQVNISDDVHLKLSVWPVFLKKNGTRLFVSRYVTSEISRQIMQRKVYTLNKSI
jgi:hypothetical protein